MSGGRAVTATVCANRDYSAHVFRQVVLDTHQLLEAGAYKHWYENYGCEEETIRTSLQLLAQVYHEYRSLVQP